MDGLERASIALREVMRYNALRNDLDQYLLDLCEWALGESESNEQPRPEQYGLKAAQRQTKESQGD